MYIQLVLKPQLASARYTLFDFDKGESESLLHTCAVVRVVLVQM